MSLQETRTFLQDLVQRFDPTLDITEGSRTSTELIEPILTRIGTDPFDDDMVTFIRTRIQQTKPEIAITEDDALTDILIDSMRILLEPLVREVKLAKLRTSLRNIDSLGDDEADALMANFFEFRKAGGFSLGVVRSYFSTPQTVSVTLVHIATSKGGLRFVPSTPQQITADQMLLNTEGTEYYVDFNFIAETRGLEYDVEAGEINSIANLPTATRVKNPRRFSGGKERETTATFVGRVQQSTSDKTLATEPGIIGVLGTSFPELTRVFSIGFGDAEMLRDVIKGGGLGAVPAADTFGSFFGTGGPVDDLDANSTTKILSAVGDFVSRLGAVNTVPSGWSLSLIYTDPVSSDLVVVDVAVLQVLSSTTIVVNHELPLLLASGAVVWALRRNEITISDIPGGITLPTNSDGTLEITSDEVHIGGKTDIYAAGAVDASSTQITSLSDAEPVARGLSATTQSSTPGSEAIVLVTDIATELEGSVLAGMSLVLQEGVDAGAYRILRVSSSPFRVLLDTEMTGTQGGLTWKIVDTINVNLMSPRDILATGDDAVLSAGSNSVSTSSGFNFLDAGVRVDDILFIDDDNGGDFLITEVGVANVIIAPAAPATLPAASYEISRRSPGLQTPVVRVKGLELLDSSGAPNGTTIPYRDPVLATSSGFQNEGAGFAYEGPGLVGLVSAGFTGAQALGSTTISWELREPAQVWNLPVDAGTFTFSGGTKTITQMVTELNANLTFQSLGIRAVALSYGGQDRLGFSSARHFRVTGGTALAVLGITVNWSNNQIRGISSATLFETLKIRSGDLLEFIEGSNAGTAVRCIEDPANSGGLLLLGTGPVGPAGTSSLIDVAPLRPEAGGRFRIARPSVGSVRLYYLAPTSAEFRYATTRFAITVNGTELVYRPDPENTRTIIPAPPLLDLPMTGSSNASVQTLTDTDADFLLLGILPGDLIDVLYIPIIGTTPLSNVGNIAVAGLTLILRFGGGPYLTISFPYGMPREDVVTFINTQLGDTVASLEVGGELALRSSERIEISLDSTVLGVLFITTLNSDHPNQGTYIVGTINSSTVLTLANRTPYAGAAVTTADTHYQIRRNVQRISSTEMNLNVDASGLYYVDVEAVSTHPGDRNNIATGLELEATGTVGDGYKLFTDNEALSYSRAEVLRAEVSRTILLVGSSDNPEEYVQLSGQNVQVTYERSAVLDDVQSFCDSAFHSVVCDEVLVRSLLPHYVNLNWSYVAGASEPTMTKELTATLAAIANGDELEVGDLVAILRGQGASSVFTPDSTSPTGRTAPLILLIQHMSDRSIKATLVRDSIGTVRTQYYVADAMTVRRLSSSGVR